MPPSVLSDVQAKNVVVATATGGSYFRVRQGGATMAENMLMVTKVAFLYKSGSFWEQTGNKSSPRKCCRFCGYEELKGAYLRLCVRPFVGNDGFKISHDTKMADWIPETTVTIASGWFSFFTQDPTVDLKQVSQSAGDAEGKAAAKYRKA